MVFLFGLWFSLFGLFLYGFSFWFMVFFFGLFLYGFSFFLVCRFCFFGVFFGLCGFGEKGKGWGLGSLFFPR